MADHTIIFQIFDRLLSDYELQVIFDTELTEISPWSTHFPIDRKEGNSSFYPQTGCNDFDKSSFTLPIFSD